MTQTIIIVDDHPSFRATARRLLELEGFAVLCEAPDGETAIDEVLRLDPDIVLLDVSLPGIDGFEVAIRLSERGSHSAIVLTSSRDRADFGTLVADSPARGFVPKGELTGDAVRALVAS
jgi:DNA-binding NarL/FixJ family response regulator